MNFVLRGIHQEDLNNVLALSRQFTLLNLPNDRKVIADKIELTPQPDENVRLVRKGKRLIVIGVKGPFDAVEAIKAVRDERDEVLARRVRGR